MQESCCKEQYPIATVIVSNLLSLLIYGIGAYVFFRSGIIWVVAYIVYILILEFRLIGGHCRDCYYYGKTCAFGKGRLSSLFFQKGDPEKFSARELTGKDIVPDFLAFILPVLAGILLLVQDFSLAILFLVIALVLLGFPGNALVRERLACRYCRQREMGCPARHLFDRSKKP